MNLDSYVRVSQVRGREGDSFISPEQQADRIRAWVKAYGHTIDREFVELDQSGARTDRPMLEEAIGRIEAGASEGLVVPRVDRFGRSLLDGLAKIERIEKAGGLFVSVQDGFDITTDTGRLVLRIMLSMAEFDLDRIRGNWHDAKSRAVRRGVHPSATPPFGYRRYGRGGPLIVDPATGPLVTELFKRRALHREGFTSLANSLQAQGVLTARGRDAWSMRAVKDIIRNRVYLGIAYAGEVENAGAHQPLTDPGTWELAQQRGERRPPVHDEPGPVCRGLLRCAGCRYKLRGVRIARSRPAWAFSCRTTGDGGWSCSEPAYTLDRGELDALVLGKFNARVPAVIARARALSPRMDELDLEVSGAQTSFAAWRDDARIQERLGMDAYLAGLEARKRTLDAALAAKAGEAQRLRATSLPADVVGLWDTFTVDQQRELLGTLIEAVFVRGTSGGPLPLAERVRVVFRGDRPALDLPATGMRGYVPRPVRFDDLDGDVAGVGVALVEDTG